MTAVCDHLLWGGPDLKAAVATLAGSAYWGWLVDRKSSLEALRVMYLIGATTPLISYIAWSPWVLVASAVTDSLLAADRPSPTA